MAGPPLGAARLNRATLARQLLLRREDVTVEQALHRVLALQAQQPASPYLALWNRVADLDPAQVDRALADGTVVKATLMRITLHAVLAREHPVLHQAMQPTLRGARLGDARFTGPGGTAAEVEALLPELLALAHRPRTGAELEAWWQERLGPPAGAGAWWAVRSFAPLRHAVTGGAWSFGTRPAFVAVAPRAASSVLSDCDDALEHLVLRYLEGFGPAGVADVAQFALVPRGRVRTAVAALGDRLVRRTGPGGVPLLDVPDGLLPEGDVPAPPRLMAMWDSVLLAHHDRSRVLPEPYRRLVIRRNGDVLPTLLVDGHVAGVWRPVAGGVEATAFHPLPPDAWDGLATEAGALLGFLAGREPTVYRRYGHWWDGLPSAQVRVLGGA